MTTIGETPEAETETAIRDRVLARETWLRGFFMLVFAVIYGVAEVVLTAVVVFQFAMRLLTGRVNPRLVGFGRCLSVYAYRILLFLTYNSDDRPFPFAPWPEAGEAAEPPARAAP